MAKSSINYEYPPLKFLRYYRTSNIIEGIEKFNELIIKDKRNTLGIKSGDYTYFEDFIFETGCESADKDADLFIFGDDFMKFTMVYMKRFEPDDFEKYIKSKTPKGTYEYDVETRELCGLTVRSLNPVLIAHKWSKYKQVYKPDPDFVAALLETEGDPKINKGLLKHLPVSDFYIDIKDLNLSALNALGIFVSVEKIITGCNELYIGMSILLPDNDYIDVSIYDITTEEGGTVVMHQTANDLNGTADQMNSEQNEYIENVLKISKFAYQFLAYLSIDMPQIEESELTKSTYKPRKKYSKVYNKPEEVQLWDVGVRYGNEYRKHIRSLSSSGGESQSDKIRKPVRPHMRRAHWRHVRYGEGRKEVRLKWIEPVFVGAKAKETDEVVIHRAKGR